MADAVTEPADPTTNESGNNNSKKEDKQVVLEAVKERLSFFFSNANLRQDKFMRNLLLPTGDNKSNNKSNNNNNNNNNDYPGHVTVETLLRFNTVKSHTTDPAVIVQAAKELSDQLVVSEDGQAIGRMAPFTLEQMDDNIPLSLLVKNLPLEEKEQQQQKDGPDDDDDKKKKKRTFVTYNVTTNEIRALFEPYGKVAMVKLRFFYDSSRRDGKDDRDGGDDDLDDLVPSRQNKNNNQKGGFSRRRIPAGSCLVEFETRQGWEKAVADLVGTMTTEDDAAKKEQGEEPQQKPPPKKTLHLKDKELEVVELETYIAASKKRKLEPENKDPAHGHDDDDEKKTKKNNGKRDSSSEEKKTFEVDWKPGCVLRLKGLGAECDREAILYAMAEGCGITVDEVKARSIYVDYSRGQEDGAVRFAEPTDDIKLLSEKLTAGDLQVKGAKVKAAFILEGEEETKYWKDYVEFKNKQMQQRNDERSSRKKHYKRPRR